MSAAAGAWSAQAAADEVSRFAAAAFAYAKSGLPVLPLLEASKVPATAHGSGDATTETAIVASWWRGRPRANVGIATGKGAANLCVVDLDGATGIRVFAELVRRHDPLAPTYTVRTPRGGLHLYFRAAEGSNLANSVGRLGPNIDVRGRGGYVVAPPSVAADGGVYQVVRRLPIASLPEWLQDITRANAFPPQRPAEPVIPRAAGEATPYGAAALAAKVDLVRAATPGRRRDALNSAAFALGQLAGEIDSSIVAGELERAALAQAEPLGLVEIRTTIANALRDGAGRPYFPERRS